MSGLHRGGVPTRGLTCRGQRLPAPVLLGLRCAMTTPSSAWEMFGSAIVRLPGSLRIEEAHGSLA